MTFYISKCVAALSLMAFISSAAWACTGLELKAKDGTYVNGRTVEFAENLEEGGLFIPRNYDLNGTLPDGGQGMAYKSKYAAIGLTTFGDKDIVDGINEKGLTAGAFYFPDYAVYSDITAENKNKMLSPAEFVTWLLTQFSTIDEIKGAINSAAIAATKPKGWPVIPPFHYVVYEKTGKSIVIEPLKGKLVVHDNPIGVITNSPTFDWHLTNLSNYINLSPFNAPTVAVDGMKLKQFGQGSGLHGLPGDFTPPSRFIRAAVYSSAAAPSDNAGQTVLQVFHILNQFDIPVGSVRSKTGDKVNNEYTQVTTVKNPENNGYYFRTFNDQTIRMVSLNALNLDDKEMHTFNMHGKTPVVDITKSLR